MASTHMMGLRNFLQVVRHNVSDVAVTLGINGNAPSHFRGAEEHLSMRISITAVCAAVALAATAVLSGCGGGASSSSFAPSTSTQQHITQSGSNARSQGSVTRYYPVTLDALGGTLSFAININSSSQASGTSLLRGNKILHAQIWRGRTPRTTDLGTLGGPNSAIFQYNHGVAGQFVGWSETSKTDPYAENYCGFGTSHICRGFSWQHGKMRSLPTLGGNNDQTNDVNKRGQIAGDSEISTKDPSCPAPHVFDYRGVIWQPNGTITTLPPYPGDTISYAYTINQSGQVAVGNSGSCAIPTAHAVLWRNASPINLGSLGGSGFNVALDINSRGQVVGDSDLSGDMVTHTFLWQSGTISDIGTLPGDVDSFAGGINDQGQVVGESCDASGNCRGFLWQNGSMTDLNTLIPPNKKLYVLFGANINDSGQIVGATVNAQGLERAVVLLPRGTTDVSPNAVSAPKVTLPESLRMQLRNLRVGPWALRKSAIPR